MSHFRLDRSCRRLDDGTALLGGSPLRLFRLSTAGATVVDAIARGDDPGSTAAVGALLDRLLDAGAVHPRPERGPWTAGDVTVVIPVLDRDVSPLVALLAEVARVIVVDDGSTPPLGHTPGAEVVRRAVVGGPGAARMTGLELVTTPLVAFADADVQPTAGWLGPLLAHFADAAVGLVAPRVTSASPPAPNRYRIGAGGRRGRTLARYEAARSPLDLGPAEGRVRARTRIGYVPAAALVVRTDALREVGGFATDLLVGEDVDLVWRLDEAGWRARYEPASVVRHEPRATLGEWLRQRVAYGRSAAPLAARHPGALAPVAVSGWSAGAWALAAAGWPLAGAGLTLGTTLALSRKLTALRRPLPVAMRLAGLGTLSAGRQLAGAVTRAWWPIALGAAVVSRRARRAVVAAAIVPPLIDYVHHRPALDPARYLVLRLADDVAYGLGLWQGALAARTVAPLLPDLASWPRPGRYQTATS